MTRDRRGRTGRRVFAMGIWLGIVALLGGLTRVPYPVGEDDEAHLRLSWRLRADQIDRCRPSGGPLEPGSAGDHMRNPNGCVPALPPFHLRVEIDGRGVIEDRIRPSGLRGDRPIYVYREETIPPGRHRLSVTFVEEGGSVERQGNSEEGDGGEETPLRFTFEKEVELGPREVLLVTLDEGGEGLRARSARRGGG